MGILGVEMVNLASIIPEFHICPRSSGSLAASISSVPTTGHGLTSPVGPLQTDRVVKHITTILLSYSKFEYSSHPKLLNTFTCKV